MGATYDPINHRFFYSPHDAIIKQRWIYYDPALQSEVKYGNDINGAYEPPTIYAGSQGYAGGSFDPIHQKIIFAPYGEARGDNWHRYNCNTQLIELYPNLFENAGGSMRPVFGAYWGSVYDPHNLKIIFIPEGQSDQERCHRYNCLTESLEEYDHQMNLSHLNNRGDRGGVYDPNNKIILFIPHQQQVNNSRTLHYYDCLTETIQSYSISGTLQSEMSFVA